MPFYDETLTEEHLKEMADTHRCNECGGQLLLAWGGYYGIDGYVLRCGSNPEHSTIAPKSRTAVKAEETYQESIRRQMAMEEEYGVAKTRALAKYEGVTSLTKPEAKEILMAVFPDAPDPEITRAMILCAGYGLNPLMKHVFLIPFNKGKENETWATVLGIKAKRLLASRKASYSYVDNTPRVMTAEEQKQIFGEVYTDKIMVITKVRDPATGGEAPGYGAWPKNQAPYGMDKGNSQFNMAAIRSESQALDRLRPGEMPVGVEVMPEEVADEAIKGAVDAEYTVLPEETAEENKKEPKKEHQCEEHGCPYLQKVKGTSIWWAHPLPGGGYCNEKKKKEAQPGLEEEPPAEEAPPPAKPQRDTLLIVTINNLYKACHEDFGMQPEDVIKELGLSSQSDITDTPAECYQKIAAVR